MKKVLLSTALAIVLSPVLLSWPGSSMADGFVNKIVNCPTSGWSLLPPGSRYNITELIVSSNGATDVRLNFTPPTLKLMELYMAANSTVVTTFDRLEGLDGQGLKVSCNGEATISITIAGSEQF